MKEALTADQKLINRLREMILDNLGNENFSVGELAKASGMSSHRLNRKLYATTNKTIHQFILEIRLHKAMELLKNEDVTASEVAYKTGFSSPSHFNTTFHKFFGYPPGKVKESVSGSYEENLISTDKLKQKKQRISWRIIAFILGISLSLFILVYLVYNLTHKVSPERSIAVLPFRNLSNDSTDQYVYDGIMEELFNNLGRVKELRVISHTSVEQFRNTTRPVRDIGKELGVNYLVEGSGQKIGIHSILRVQLIEVSADKHIWTGSYELEFIGTEDLFRQISLIAQSIASELGATITPEEKVLIERVPTQNATAYNLYLKANNYRLDYERTRNISSYQTAANLYYAALEIDTVFARAYTGLALAYWGRYYSETYFKGNFMDSCRILADRALQIDDKLDEAYYIKGRYFRENGQFEKALENFDRALKFNPNYSQVYCYRGTLFAWVLNDYCQGIENFNKALELIYGNDRASILGYLGNLYMNVGFFEKAEYYFKEALVLNGDSARYFGNLTWVEFSRENFEGALKMTLIASEIDTTYLSDFIICSIPPVTVEEAYRDAVKLIKASEKSGRLILQDTYRIGYALYQAGKYDQAEYYFNQQIKYSEEGIKLNRDIAQRKVAHYDLAAVSAFKGEKMKAYKYLDEYSERSYFRPAEISLTKNDPLFASINGEERFKNIVKKMETRYQAEHDRVKKWLEKEGMI